MRRDTLKHISHNSTTKEYCEAVKGEHFGSIIKVAKKLSLLLIHNLPRLPRALS